MEDTDPYDDELEEEERLDKLRKARKLEYAINPKCCTGGLTLIDAMVRVEASLEHVNETPEWYFAGRPIHYCPYCGDKLPGFRKREDPPEPMQAPRMMGYCKTCSERIWTCVCYPPIAKYETDT